MVADLMLYRSHPDKPLLLHTQGVVDRVRSLTTLKIAEVAAIFHDLGKINPNFQQKLDNRRSDGYSNHAYLSALSFLCYCAANKDNVLKILGNHREYVAAILAIIAHHHGELPDFQCVLDLNEFARLSTFLKKKPVLPLSEFLQDIVNHNEFDVFDEQLNDYFQSDLQYKLTMSISNPLDFFLETHFSFASLITADKSDASGYEKNVAAIQEFCSEYHNRLDAYLDSFSSDTKLNKLRSHMREEACNRITQELINGHRVFSLTAPTGSGKTMMLLSLAGKILRHQNNLRIIYALPFLSITEQVDAICHQVFKGVDNHIGRIDSKTDNANFGQSQSNLDYDPSAIKEVLSSQFTEDTFDYPFIITTFVRFFETLLSNQNATLLKLPNFANTILLIDEIQSLPPRLYGFFVAMLDAFCRKFNSYAVVSTATMPNFLLPLNNKHNLSEIFIGYMPPPELLPLIYFEEQAFNRYDIERLSEINEIKEIVDMLRKEINSVLVILNTIQDTKELYNELTSPGINGEIVLLNTHFTPDDRKRKIEFCKRLLEENKRIILISTQLIEAGVDIDFPVVYRDICPIPNIIQSAGRCNRNGKYPTKGKIRVFNLQKNGVSRSATIYRGRDSFLLNFAKGHLKEKVFKEPEMISLQKSFFDEIQANLLFGVHYYRSCEENKKVDFIESLKKAEFAEIGKFKLIDEQEFGKECRYYISQGDEDSEFEKLENLFVELKKIDINNYASRKFKKIQIENQLKIMSVYIVQVRLRNNDSPPLAEKEGYGLLKLSKDQYSGITGICLSSENQIL